MNKASKGFVFVAVLAGLFSANAASSQYYDGGLVVCYGNHVKSGKTGIVLGSRNDTKLLKTISKYKNTTTDSKPDYHFIMAVLESVGESTYVFLDRNLKNRNGIIIGDSGDGRGLTQKHVRGCEVILPLKLCDHPRYPVQSVMCE